MQELVEKTDKFMQKHNFTRHVLLGGLKTDEHVDRMLGEAAKSLINISKHIEAQMLIHDDLRLRRSQLLIEELGETVQALADKNEIEVLDGLSDLGFVTIGTAIAFALPFIRGLNEICDSNLTKNARKKDDIRLRDKGADYKPPNLKEILNRHRHRMSHLYVQARRTHCITGQVKFIPVRIERRWHDSLDSWWIAITEGGVTGYESMRTVDVKECRDGWHACAGTHKRWDELFLPAKSMLEIQSWLETQT